MAVKSRVWLQADMEDGNVVFQAESDALIVKGIIALLIKSCIRTYPR